MKSIALENWRWGEQRVSYGSYNAYFLQKVSPSERLFRNYSCFTVYSQIKKSQFKLSIIPGNCKSSKDYFTYPVCIESKQLSITIKMRVLVCELRCVLGLKYNFNIIYENDVYRNLSCNY